MDQLIRNKDLHYYTMYRNLLEKTTSNYSCTLLRTKILVQSAWVTCFTYIFHGSLIWNSIGLLQTLHDINSRKYPWYSYDNSKSITMTSPTFSISCRNVLNDKQCWRYSSIESLRLSADDLLIYVTVPNLTRFIKIIHRNVSNSFCAVRKSV